MNIGIVLDYFKFFIPFSQGRRLHRYYYTTARSRFKNANVRDLSYCDSKRGLTSPVRSPKGDWTQYFRAAIRLGSISSVLHLDRLAVLYEDHFQRLISDNQLDILIAGGTSGFERCGLAIAQKSGIKTLCVWEGFFRPNTISYDVGGMNAESDFYKLTYSQIMSKGVSNQALAFVDNYIGLIKKNLTAPLSLRQIQGIRFNVFHQLRNRWEDRNDFERVRLPFLQHTNARISYSMYRKTYVRLSDLSRPFLFFPLQTHTDSNIAINGDLVPYEKYVEIVVRAFNAARSQLNCDLLIKEHPFDVLRHAYNRNARESVLWLAPETPVSQIILSDNCLGTVAVNSTAAFECLLLGKPVMTLGRSMFSHKELVEIPRSLDAQEIARSLRNLVKRKVDKHEVAEFAARLFDGTQLVGNLEDNPSREEISRFEELFGTIVKG